MARTTRRQDPATPHARLSPTGTYVQLGLVLLVLVTAGGAIATFVRAGAKADGLNQTVEDLQTNMSVVSAVATKLSENLITLNGEIKNLSEKVGTLQGSSVQSDRDQRSLELRLAGFDVDLKSLKDRVTAAEAAVKAVEARMISVEISSHQTGTAASPPRGDGQ